MIGRLRAAVSAMLSASASKAEPAAMPTVNELARKRSRRDADEVRRPAMRAQRISFVVAVLATAVLVRAAIPPDVERSLKESKYVYVQSERKSGAFGKPAEIWFLYEGGTVYVASPPTT